MAKPKRIYNFVFNLQTNSLHKPDPKNRLNFLFYESAWGDYCVRYQTTPHGKFAEVGDGYRHEITVEGRQWNRLLKLIREDELDASGLEAVLSLMSDGLPAEYKNTFVDAVKTGKIKDI